MQRVMEQSVAIAAVLPLHPPKIALKGRFVFLEPLSLEHADELHAISNGAPFNVPAKLSLPLRSVKEYDADATIWRYMPYGPFKDAAEFQSYVSGLLIQQDLTAFVVRDAASRQALGVTTYMSHQPRHLKVELGNIWFSPIAQGTKANSETQYLLLKHAFETGYLRLEWKCNALNDRSRASAERLGFTFEGIQQWHLIVKGYHRDTAWFRLLASEWPDKQAALERHLYKVSTWAPELA